MDEPEIKRTVAFFDGQNLYRHAMEVFGYHHPNYHPIKLFEAVCSANDWRNRGIRFYTGVPDVFTVKCGMATGQTALWPWRGPGY